MRCIALRVLLTILTCLLLASTDAQLIFTKAGGNSGIGDYFSATEAGLAEPVATAVDAKGNVFIAERWGNRIRRVDAATSVITTFAGRGLPSNYSGDGGPALDAVFFLPTGIVTDGAGNLYISDQGNFRIRKVDAVSGIISTIAGNGTQGYAGDGGPAISASISHPGALAIDRNDNIYFVDRTNNRIRKITKSTGIITTVAGNGSGTFSGDGGLATDASFESLSGVALDNAGNIYVADTDSRVRKVNVATGIITTMAGNGLREFAGDGGPATAASFGLYGVEGSTTIAVDQNNNLYITDHYNGRVRKVDAITGIITTVAGNGSRDYTGDGGPATEAGLGTINSISVDSKGDIYINDLNRYIIRRVEAATGIITTFAGNGKTHYLGDGKKAAEVAIGPGKLAFDNSNNLVIAEPNGRRIRHIDAVTSIVTIVAGNGDVGGYSGDGRPATEAVVEIPNGVAIDKEGNIYIIDYQRRIRKVSAATVIISHFAGDSTGMGYGGDGGPASKAAFDLPSDITFDDKGNLFVADAGSHAIRRIDAVTGIITTVAGTGIFGFSNDGGLATATKLTWPSGVAVDKAGNLYIAESYNHRIRKVDAATGIITTVAGNGNKGYFGDGGPATGAWLNSPDDITFDSNGNLYIVDTENHCIRKVDAISGIISTIAGQGATGFSGDGGPATAAFLHYPTDVGIDREGVICISDSYNYRIRMICPAATLPSATTTGISRVYPGQNSTVVFAENCSLQATLQASGINPVSGIVTDTVWIEPTVPTVNGQPYVQRHYGITPQQNASTATGRLTLYFTQADFTAYNAAPNHGLDLPHDAADVANDKANLLIKKRSGTSRDGSGRFEAYSGATIDIVPSSVVWDTTLRAWAVTFEVNGFSGFFVTSASSTLPLTLLKFSAQLHSEDVLLTWNTANEEGISGYEVERSTDGNQFSGIGSIAANNRAASSYTFTDDDLDLLNAPLVYYRLKIGEQSGVATFSDVVSVAVRLNGHGVKLYPNPVSVMAILEVHSPRSELLQCRMIDGSGRIVYIRNVTVMKGRSQISLPVNTLVPGLYTIQLKGTVTATEIKFVKQ